MYISIFSVMCLFWFATVLQNGVFSILFAIAFFVGGVVSGVNSSNARLDYDDNGCKTIHDNEFFLSDSVVEQCDLLETIGITQITTAVSLCKYI